MLTEVEVLFVVEEKVLRRGAETIRVDMGSEVGDDGGVRLGVEKRSNAFLR